MRASEFLLSTLKETPSDAEVVSHQLMLRAGLIRQVAAGIYNWIVGLRVLRKVENVVREEMERAGALELTMLSTGGWRSQGGGSNTAPSSVVSRIATSARSVWGPPTRRSSRKLPAVRSKATNIYR